MPSLFEIDSAFSKNAFFNVFIGPLLTQKPAFVSTSQYLEFLFDVKNRHISLYRTTKHLVVEGERKGCFSSKERAKWDASRGRLFFIRIVGNVIELETMLTQLTLLLTAGEWDKLRNNSRFVLGEICDHAK